MRRVGEELILLREPRLQGIVRPLPLFGEEYIRNGYCRKGR